MGGLISIDSRRFFPKLVLCLGLVAVTLGLGVRSTKAIGGGVASRNGHQRGWISYLLAEAGWQHLLLGKQLLLSGSAGAR